MALSGNRGQVAARAPQRNQRKDQMVRLEASVKPVSGGASWQSPFGAHRSLRLECLPEAVCLLRPHRGGAVLHRGAVLVQQGAGQHEGMPPLDLQALLSGSLDGRNKRRSTRWSVWEPPNNMQHVQPTSVIYVVIKDSRPVNTRFLFLFLVS